MVVDLDGKNRGRGNSVFVVFLLRLYTLRGLVMTSFFITIFLTELLVLPCYRDVFHVFLSARGVGTTGFHSVA